MLDIEKKAAIEQLNLQGRHCLYREKSLLVSVKIEEITLYDNSLHIEMSYQWPVNAQECNSSVGAALEYIDIEKHALLVNGYISFYLIFDEELLKQLNLIFASHPEFDRHTQLKIANDAAYHCVKPIDFYVEMQNQMGKNQ